VSSRFFLFLLESLVFGFCQAAFVATLPSALLCESVRSCVKTVLEKTGRIDALVNNAGYTLIAALEETTIDEAKQVFETNFFGALRMTAGRTPPYARAWVRTYRISCGLFARAVSGDLLRE